MSHLLPKWNMEGCLFLKNLHSLSDDSHIALPYFFIIFFFSCYTLKLSMREKYKGNLFLFVLFCEKVIWSFFLFFPQVLLAANFGANCFALLFHTKKYFRMKNIHNRTRNLTGLLERRCFLMTWDHAGSPV